MSVDLLRAARLELDPKLYLNIAAFIMAPPLLVVMFAAFVNSPRVFEAAIRPTDFASFVATSSDFSVSSTALRKSFCAWLSLGLFQIVSNFRPIFGTL